MTGPVARQARPGRVPLQSFPRSSVEGSQTPLPRLLPQCPSQARPCLILTSSSHPCLRLIPISTSTISLPRAHFPIKPVPISSIPSVFPSTMSPSPPLQPHPRLVFCLPVSPVTLPDKLTRSSHCPKSSSPSVAATSDSPQVLPIHHHHLSSCPTVITIASSNSLSILLIIWSIPKIDMYVS